MRFTKFIDKNSTGIATTGTFSSARGPDLVDFFKI